MRKKHRASGALRCAVAILSAIFLSLPLSSCGRKKYTEYTFDYFDTVTTVIGYASSEEEFREIYELVTFELERYHKLFDIYNSYKGIVNLCDVNRVKDGSHEVLTVDGAIIDLLLFAKEVHELTGGRVNAAIGSVTSVWHTYMEHGRENPDKAELPSAEELRDASLHCDIDEVTLDEKASSVYLADPLMKLDVGALAKGYAAEQTAQLLEKRGISGYVLNLGGNVRTVGTQANGSPWSVGIENPDDPDGDSYTATLSLAGESLVTSGIYRRAYTVDGVSYHHIIDPDTLMPAEGYKSVSVVCRDSALGDALSTALFSMSIEDGLALVSKTEGTEALWIKDNGETVTSSGFDSYLRRQ